MPIVYSGPIPFAQAGTARAAQYAMLVPQAQAEAWRRAVREAEARAADQEAARQAALDAIDARLKALQEAAKLRRAGAADYNKALLDVWAQQVKAGTRTLRTSITEGGGRSGGSSGSERLDPATGRAIRAYEEARSRVMGSADLSDPRALAGLLLDIPEGVVAHGAAPGDIGILAQKSVADALEMLEAEGARLGVENPAQWAADALAQVAQEDPARMRTLLSGLDRLEQSMAERADTRRPKVTTSITRKEVPNIPPPDLVRPDTKPIEDEIASLLAKREAVPLPRAAGTTEAREALKGLFGGTILGQQPRRPKGPPKPTTYKARILARAVEMVQDPEAFARLREEHKPPGQRNPPPWVRTVDELFDEAKQAGEGVAEVWRELPKAGLSNKVLDEARAYLLARARLERDRAQ